jgi:hypothetical protein
LGHEICWAARAGKKEGDARWAETSRGKGIERGGSLRVVFRLCFFKPQISTKNLATNMNATYREPFY